MLYITQNNMLMDKMLYITQFYSSTNKKNVFCVIHQKLQNYTSLVNKLKRNYTFFTPNLQKKTKGKGKKLCYSQETKHYF